MQRPFYSDYDLDDPVFKKAFDLAQAFVTHCDENDIPKDFMIVGVRRNSYKAIEEAYIKGKRYEKERLAILLGLS